jgi:hypothetical protein
MSEAGDVGVVALHGLARVDVVVAVGAAHRVVHVRAGAAGGLESILEISFDRNLT